MLNVEARYNDQCYSPPMVIVKDAEEARMPTLLGRNWLSKIKIRWHEVMSMKIVTKAVPLTEKYKQVFEPGYGAI